MLAARDSWHPLVAASLARAGGSFVPNDLFLGASPVQELAGPARGAGTGGEGEWWTRSDAAFLALTGPNMGGKSTVLRQAGTLVLLAQLGCAVPAAACALSPVDRVFTRLGAFDSIFEGDSTFMVEMKETQHILSRATPSSLVLIDELGRGTATFDGVSIAYAVAQHLMERTRCRTLFSTHYHALVSEFARRRDAALAHMSHAVDACAGPRVVFLFRLRPGPSGRSFGMNVARLACLPDAVVQQAEAKSAAFERTTRAQRLRAVAARALALTDQCRGVGAPASDNSELVEVWGAAGNL